MAPKPLLRIRPHVKKTFGEAFGEATYAASLQDAGLFLWVFSQGLHPGLVCDAPLGHGIGNTVGARHRKRDGGMGLETWWGHGTGNAMGAWD